MICRLIKQTGTSGITREFKEIEDYLANTREILGRANIPGLNLAERQNLLADLKSILDRVEGKLQQAEVSRYPEAVVILRPGESYLINYSDFLIHSFKGEVSPSDRRLAESFRQGGSD